jgi:alkylation response protein AidB-like acyl-CoA dehydrogenase
VEALDGFVWSDEQREFNGPAEQKEKFLLGLNGSSFGGSAMSKAECESNAFSLSTNAKKENGKCLLNGKKLFITNVPIADLLFVFATVNKTRVPEAISAFLAEKGTPGMKSGPKIEKMGVRTAQMSEVLFENCAVPEENFRQIHLLA